MQRRRTHTAASAASERTRGVRRSGHGMPHDVDPHRGVTQEEEVAVSFPERGLRSLPDVSERKDEANASFALATSPWHAARGELERQGF